MKIEQNKKQNRFAQRTLEAFSQSMIKLLEVETFETITVNQICEKSNYPRSTFYNYFEDIFDLMNYCWERIGAVIAIDEYEQIVHDERLLVLFERLYSYMESKQKQIDRILAHNNVEGKMVQSLNRYIRQKIRKMILNCPEMDKYPIPFELMAEHYSNTLQLILGWCFMKKEKLSKKQAIEYINYLLGTLEKVAKQS